MSLPHLGQGSAAAASYKVQARARSALGCSAVFSTLVSTTEPHTTMPRARHCNCPCRPSRHAVLNEEEHLREQEEWVRPFCHARLSLQLMHIEGQKKCVSGSRQSRRREYFNVLKSCLVPDPRPQEAVVELKLGKVAHMPTQADGLRWSEMSRLPYWAPSLQLTVPSEFLHSALEGLPVAAIKISLDAAGIANDLPPACAFDSAEFDPENPVIVRTAWDRVGDTTARKKEAARSVADDKPNREHTVLRTWD